MSPDFAELSPTIALAERISETKARNPNVLDFTAGEPRYTTDSSIINACVDSIRNGDTHYCDSQGMESLRDSALRRYCGAVTDLSVDNVSIFPSAKAAIATLMYVLAGCGRHVVIVGPTWPTYSSICKLNHTDFSYAYPYYEKNAGGFVNRIMEKVREDTELVVICNPNNPTGRVLAKQWLEQIVVACSKMGIYVLLDEIYSELTDHHNFVSATKWISSHNVVVVNGFSKSFAMTGWRLGLAFFPGVLQKNILAVVHATFSCCPKFVQVAGDYALNHRWHTVKNAATIYASQREIIRESTAGSSISLDEYCCSTIYAWMRLNNSSMPATAFARKLLERSSVAVIPGAVFGENEDNHFRMSLTVSEPELAEGIARIKYMANLIGEHNA